MTMPQLSRSEIMVPRNEVLVTDDRGAEPQTHAWWDSYFSVSSRLSPLPGPRPQQRIFFSLSTGVRSSVVRRLSAALNPSVPRAGFKRVLGGSTGPVAVH